MEEYRYSDASDLSVPAIEALFYQQMKMLSMQAAKRLPTAKIIEIDQLLASM